MNIKRIIIIVFFVYFACVLTLCFMRSRKQFVDFSEIYYEIVSEDGVDLTIYYMSPNTATLAPLSVDDLIFGSTAMNEKKKKDEINGQFEYKIIVNSNKLLEEHYDLLNQIKDFVFEPVEDKTYTNVRIYYVFEIKKEHKTFDVAMWGGRDKHIFVNGVEVKGDSIFYDIIMPFLPEDAAKELEGYLGRKQ